MFKYLILGSLMISQIAMAADGPVTHLLVGQPASYEGYLFSVSKELEVRQAMVELDATKQLLDINGQLVKLKDTQISLLSEQSLLWQNQSRDLSAQLVSKENSRFYMFLAGALTTTALAFAVSRAVR